MWTSTYYGQWDYWELRHKVTFDGPNRLIYINDGVTSLDAQIDLYSDWKEWIQLEDYMKWPAAFSVVGGEPLPGGVNLDATFFLINGWKLKPYPGSYDLLINGNLFDVNGESIKVPADIDPLFPNNISISTNTSVVVRSLDGSGGSSGSFDPDQIVSASLFGTQEAALFDISGSNELIYAELLNISGSIVEINTKLNTAVTASLVQSQQDQLTNIENLTVSQSQTIASQSLAINQLTATNASQSAALTDLQGKLLEVWQIHGLDVNNPLFVSRTQRLVAAIDQNISTVGSGSSQETTIDRN